MDGILFILDQMGRQLHDLIAERDQLAEANRTLMQRLAEAGASTA